MPKTSRVSFNAYLTKEEAGFIMNILDRVEIKAADPIAAQTVAIVQGLKKKVAPFLIDKEVDIDANEKR